MKIVDKIKRSFERHPEQSDGLAAPVAAPLPALTAVVVEPVSYGNDVVKYKLMFHFITVDGPKDILIASVTNGEMINELAAMVRSELGME